MFQTLRKLKSRYSTSTAARRPAISRAVEPVRCEALESRQLLAATIALTGTVYQDLNNNGKVEAGEAGIAGVTINLTGKTAAGAAVTMTTKTNAQGRYAFNVAAGTYSLAEVQAAGFLNGKTSTGFVGGAKAGVDIVTGINVTGSVTCAAADFGEIKPGGINGTVYVDTNNNGVIDVGEKRISNVLITLTGANDQGAVTLTAHTDVNGNYSFGNLRPGTYVITETQPAGYLQGKLTLGSAGGTIGADIFSSVKIGQGQIGANYNFGELLPPPPPSGGGGGGSGGGGGTGGGTGGTCKKGHSDGHSDGSKDCKNKGGSDGHSDGSKDCKKHSDGGSDGHSDGSKDCKKHSDGGSDGHSDGSKDCKNKGGSDGHSDGGKDKNCHCDGHPDNGNNKNRGCGNAYGVPNRDAKSNGKGH